MTRLIAALLAALPLVAAAAEYMEKMPFQLSRAFSPGVITEGGRIVWVAGQTAKRDNAGNDIANNFEARVKQVFSQIDAVLKRAGGGLNGNYPDSALVTVTNFARPGIEIEIQAVGVIGDRWLQREAVLGGRPGPKK